MSFATKMSPFIDAQLSLKGRTAIVSGAASGLGLAIAETLAGAGANVAILFHSSTTATEAAHSVAEKYNVQCELLIMLTEDLVC